MSKLGKYIVIKRYEETENRNRLRGTKLTKKIMKV